MADDSDSEEIPAKRIHLASAEEATDSDLVSDLLNQPRVIVIQILNHLDGLSLKELAFSCQGLYNFIMHTGGIHAPLQLKEVEKTATGFVYTCHCGHRHYNLPLYLESLRRWPLTLSIDEFVACEDQAWSAQDPVIRPLLVENRVWIRSLTVDVPENLREAYTLYNFVERVNLTGGRLIERLSLNDHLLRSADPMKMCLMMPVLEVITGFGWGYSVPLDDYYIRHCIIPTVRSQNAIEASGVTEAVKIWKTNYTLKNWRFVYRPGIDWLECLGPCEIRHFSNEIPVDPLHPPVFLRIVSQLTGQNIRFFVLRPDRKVISIHVDPHEYSDEGDNDRCVEFSVCPVDELPPALRSL